MDRKRDRQKKAKQIEGQKQEWIERKTDTKKVKQIDRQRYKL